MTATVATVGMLPAALATGVGTDVQRNLATVVVGGLSTPPVLVCIHVGGHNPSRSLRVKAFQV